MTGNRYDQRTDHYIQLIQRQEGVIFWVCYFSSRFRKDKVVDYQQDVLERLWRTLDTLPEDSSPAAERAWVRMQARSAIGAQQRHEHPTLPIDDYDPPDDDSARECRELLDEYMAYLPDDDRHLLEQQLSGYSAEELAAELGITTEAVFQRLSRARRRLRTIRQQLDK